MMQDVLESRASQLLITAVLAVPLAVAITLMKPGLGEMLALGLIVLLVAFLFPLTGLYLIVVSMLLGPEFEVGSGQLGAGAQFARGLTLRLDDFLMVLVGSAWLAKVAVVRQGVQYLQTPLNRSIAYYLGASILATLIGVLLGRVRPFAGFFFLLKYYEYFFLYFMTVNLVTDEKQIKRLVTVSLATFFLVSLFAIFQMAQGERASAPFEGKEGEPNTLGGYLVFMLSIVTGLLVIPGAFRRRGVLIMVLLCGFVALQATLSRSSYLAAGVVVMVFLVYISRRRPLLMTFVIFGILTTPVWAPQSVQDRVLYTFTQSAHEGEQFRIGGVKVDTSTTDRLRSWQQAVKAWTTSPLWGLGVTGGPFMDAMYPKLLADVGILGIVAFGYLMWSLFRLARSGLERIDDPYFTGLITGFLFGFVGMLVHGIGANTFIIVRIMEPFWLYAALIAKVLHLRTATSVPAKQESSRPEMARRVASWGSTPA